MSCLVVSGGDTGIANGQDGTPERKTVQRSPGDEYSAPPVPVTRRKGHGNSEPDRPGKAQDLGKP